MSLRFDYLSLTVGLFLLSPLCHAATTNNAPSASATPPATNAPGAAAMPPTDPASRLIAEGIVLMNHNDVDGALAKLNESIQTDPHNPGAYVLRASIYCQKKLWT